uniref:Taste receptor type 2 n=1 Tax=Castor canadensis TaxID=51338 RepID=A0A8C0WD52_CASCN
MWRALKSIFFIIMVAEFIFGNLSNGFIVVMNCIDLGNKRNFSSVDQIITILAISRISVLWQTFVSLFQNTYYSFSLVDETKVRIGIFSWIVSNHFSLWFATILSILYLLKIATFSWPAFLYLKWRVKKVTLIMLLGNLVFLILNLTEVDIHIEDLIHQLEKNTTWDSKVSEIKKLSMQVRLKITLFSLIPFTVALTSCLLLIVSLWKHLQKMQLTSKGRRDPRTKALINALKIMISFLLLYAAYFLSYLISWISKVHENTLAHFVGITVGLLYPSGHSFILILGNSKLRQTSLLGLKCFM